MDLWTVIGLIMMGGAGLAVYWFAFRSNGFDDPASLSTETIVAAIAGQADWLEQLMAANGTNPPAELASLALRRRQYIQRLSIELLGRKENDGRLRFEEVAGEARKLEALGTAPGDSAAIAVKRHLFGAAGHTYRDSWTNKD